MKIIMDIQSLSHEVIKTVQNLYTFREEYRKL